MLQTVTILNFSTALKNVDMDFRIDPNCGYPKFISDHCLKQTNQASWLLFWYNYSHSLPLSISMKLPICMTWEFGPNVFTFMPLWLKLRLDK